MLKKYEDFKKQNESMKKFSNMSKDKKVNDEGDIRRDDTLNNYDEEINVDILKQKRSNKMSTPQTNIPNNKQEQFMDTSGVKPKKLSKDEEGGIVTENRKVKQVGKIAKFPKGTKASKAYNFLEDVKISKNKIWYILIEKQENELQMVKYATKKGVNLTEFINELKTYYIETYANTEEDKALFENIQVAGDKPGNYSAIKNIPNIDINGTKFIRKITEDLTKLLNGKCK